MASVTAPSRLSSEGKKMWRAITNKYELRADELEILSAACAERDLIERMEAGLEGQELVTEGSQGQMVAHPFLAELRQHRASMQSLLRTLKLPDDAEGEGAVNQQRDAASSKWSVNYGKGA